MAWNPGQQLFGDRYIIERELGRGGIGITYLARNPSDEFRVIKTLLDKFFNDPKWTPHCNKLRQDFRDEALRLALCHHPHIVQIENVFDEGNFPCMAMEYIEGQDLGKRITENGALSEAEALIYIQQIGDALTLVHNKGLLHRDLKPSNIMMRAGKPEAVLIDFGIARQFIPGAIQQHTENRTDGYAPPEQYVPDAERGEYIDVYALAATLYALLTGQLPMPAPARLQNFTLRSPKELNSSVSDQVNEAIMKGMALNYRFRPQSVQEWLNLLGTNVGSISATTPQTQSNQSTQNTSRFIFQVSQSWECVQTIRNYADSVHSLAFSPDGKLLATGLYSVKLWQLINGQEIKTYEYPSWILTFSANGKNLASSLGEELSVWDIDSGKENLNFTLGWNNIDFVAFSSDGQMLAASMRKEEIQLWDVNTGDKVRTITITERYGHLVFSLDGRILAGATVGMKSEDIIKLWEVSTGKEICTIYSRSKYINALALSPDGEILASEETYGGFFYPSKSRIRLWDVANGKNIYSIKADSEVSSLAFSPNGDILASVDRYNGNVKVWLLSRVQGKQVKLTNIHTLTSSYRGFNKPIKFSPDGRILADGITLWDVASGREIYKLNGHSEAVDLLTISPDGQNIATTSKSGITLWHIPSGTFIRRFEKYSLDTVVFSANGKILISANKDRMILWEVATGRKIQDTPCELKESRVISAVALSQDGEIYAQAAYSDKKIRLIKVSTDQNISTITTQSEGVGCLAFSPNKEILASSSFDKIIKLWEVKTGEAIRTINTYPHSATSIAFSPNGKILVCGGSDCIQLWDVETHYGRLICTINTSIISSSNSSSAKGSLIFSPDGQILASSSNDNTIKLWDVASGNEIGTLTGHSSQVNSILFSRDGQILVSAANDGSIKIWQRS
ncbi:serine/threonine-protein kinase [Nostoc sp. UHCC 0302]|uniref:serine/threonine-protein kinase n=1 Tax=Nostoc sp. UHCC 0302 TaxID=3134896 RepID=UPI00311C94E6